MVQVVYNGGSREVWNPDTGLTFANGEPKEVSEEEAEVLLSNPDFQKVTTKKKEEGEK